MNIRKTKYNYNIEDIIKMNLTTQSAQKVLKERFGLFNYNFDTIFSGRYMRNYLAWDESKRNEFIVTIGGKINFRKTKTLIEGKLGETK